MHAVLILSVERGTQKLQHRRARVVRVYKTLLHDVCLIKVGWFS